MLQVLKNVVENAVAFSKEGKPVEISARSADGMAMVITVADHGPGFRSEDLPHVFKPFFTRRAGGSGLGLAIAQKIVTEHGGTITAANRPEGGAVIEIRLGEDQSVPATDTTPQAEAIQLELYRAAGPPGPGPV